MEEQKKTTAEKKAKGKGFPWSLIRWICMAPLAFIWWVFTFKMAGYSFTALVCLCLIGILLFYNVAELLDEKFPKPVKIIRRIFTVCL